MLLSVPRVHTVTQRWRATYHKEHGRRWFPKSVKRFMLQYPKVPLYAMFGLLSMGFFHQFAYAIYKKATLSKSEFQEFTHQFNSIVKGRVTLGDSLWIPFLRKDVTYSIIPDEIEIEVDDDAGSSSAK